MKGGERHQPDLGLREEVFEDLVAHTETMHDWQPGDPDPNTEAVISLSGNGTPGIAPRVEPPRIG